MKRILLVAAIVAASMSCAGSVYADEYAKGTPDEYGLIKSYGLKNQKDECLIVAKNCIGGSDSAVQRAERLRREMKKGAGVYTPEELKALQDQLNWINSENEFNPGGVY